jgi:hypothetical protein
LSGAAGGGPDQQAKMMALRALLQNLSGGGGGGMGARGLQSLLSGMTIDVHFYMLPNTDFDKWYGMQCIVLMNLLRCRY